MLTVAERKLAGYLLRLASEEYANHGANELDLLKAGLTPEESVELRTQLIRAGDYPDDPVRPDNHIVMDWLAMHYMADRILGPAK